MYDIDYLSVGISCAVTLSILAVIALSEFP